jgi:RNA polymerase sigma factor (sigma-70 family)
MVDRPTVAADRREARTPTPRPTGTDPTGRAVAERSVAHLGKLLRFARVELSAREALGYLPPGDLRPEEIVDAALLDALEHADDAPADGLYGWLRGFVRRAIEREVAAARPRRRYRYLEAPARPPRVEDEGQPRRLVEVLPDPRSPIPDKVVESLEFQRALLELLGQMPETWRETFLLLVFDGLTVEQVAEVEAIAAAEVRRRLRYAREFLRERLVQEYLDEPVTPPSEALFKRLDRQEPTPEDTRRVGRRLAAALSRS